MTIAKNAKFIKLDFGIMEYWKNGLIAALRMADICKADKSDIPIFHNSILPSLAALRENLQIIWIILWN